MATSRAAAGRRALARALALGAALAWSGAASAAPLLLEDASSFVSVDPGARFAVSAWTLDGVVHLREQGYWIGIGGAPEIGLGALHPEVPLISDTDGDGSTDTAFVRFVDPADRFTIEMRWSLQGSPFGSPASGAAADLVTQVAIANTSGSVLDLTLFQYSDVDLFGSFADDQATFSGDPPNTLRVTDASGLGAYESVASRAPEAVEAAPFAALLASLEDGAPTVLSGALGAAGDVTAAMAWRALLPAGGALLFSQDQTLARVPVPEPAAAALVALGGGLLAAHRARRGGGGRREGCARRL